MFLEALLISALELLGLLSFKRFQKSRSLEHLNSPGHGFTQLPIIHNLTSKIKGNPTTTERFLADKTVKSIRKVVSTSSFEHIVQGCYTKNSVIRKSLQGNKTSAWKLLTSK